MIGEILSFATIARYNLVMNDSTFASMIERLSQSALPVQALVTGFGYMLGIVFFIIGLRKLKTIADHRARSSSQIPMLVPISYFLGGIVLIFIPEAISVASNTFFGAGNVLAYAKVKPINVIGAMTILVQTAGIIWFVRGTALLVAASNPGVQHGPKGLAFLIAGILAMNFEATMSTINSVMNYATSMTLAFRGKLGY